MQLRLKIQEILKRFNQPDRLGVDFLSFELPDLMAKVLRGQLAEPDGIRLCCEIGDLLFSGDDNLSVEQWKGLFQYLRQAGLPRFEALPLQRWISKSLPRLGANASELFEALKLNDLFYDPWTMRNVSSALKSPAQLRSALVSRHQKLEDQALFGLSITSEARYGQGSSMKGWLSEAFKRAEIQDAPASVLASMCLLAVGPLEEETHHLYLEDPLQGRKSWRQPLFLGTFKKLRKSIGEAKLPDPRAVRTSEEARHMLEEFWQNADLLSLDMNSIQSFHFLEVALGICPFRSKDAAIVCSPGVLLMPLP